MFCTSCGKQIDNDSSFCSFCGAKVTSSATTNDSTTSNNAQTLESTNTDMPVFTPPGEEVQNNIVLCRI